MTKRTASIKRQTTETTISLSLNLDGSGQAEMCTGVRLFDHMLSQLAKHGLFDINISANGDDIHHLVEDVALTLGKAFNEALGERKGIVRMADATVPMDDSLATVALDLSGRGYAVVDLPFSKNDLTGFPTDLVRHFLETFAIEGRFNLHARILYGSNDHHKAEALFKALARALDKATSLDPRREGIAPSTKGMLEN
ncbi:MAG: imidazoleglycerol-phosphate dehydratase HisB [Dehalococcoides mccartyi]|uniref:Imidazoleglycerol-phosphate dehydratase n=1 Tax=Dehalococcoides mccartyi TaxID=61435 RepID=A0AB38ZAE1_9CHLR|nr:imidazoleglycerol-phosphate dehydratase HisB [Dehalococcoides mccartyi]OBW61847.1 MAG: imidazoleglycerol-phosphate dehydratase [Dehalococcoides mccartyi]WRO07531.1 imidazoleglycerol-phosphate dehydratase HisB [Dehalococcoides mccartyi]